MNRALRSVLMVVVGSVFLFSSFMVFRYNLETRRGEKYTEELAQAAVVSSGKSTGNEYAETSGVAISDIPLAQPEKQIHEDPADVLQILPAENPSEKPADAAPQPEGEIIYKPSRVAPIRVDFDVLRKENKDVVAWVYCPDTPINYPVVQAPDNEYYLHRRLDGIKSYAGTLFMDYRNTENLSDWNSVIYGHNMKNNSMFGTLTDYKKQSYFESHPEIFLLTPECDYAIKLLAGFLTTADSEVYNTFNPSDDEKIRLMENWLYESDFISGNSPASEDRLITLSTCSYEYSDARYVLIGTLEELADWEE